MTKLACKSCGQSRYVKSGTIRGNQRYLCQGCGCNFTATASRGKPSAMKPLSVLLYAGHASQGMIARLLGISHVAVGEWVRKQVAHPSEPSVNVPDGARCGDQMGHFVDGIKTRLGAAEPSILWQGEPWPGSWVAVITGPDNKTPTTPGSKDASSQQLD